MKSYLLDGKEAQDKDYVACLEALRDEDDMSVAIPGECGLSVSVCSDGYFVTEERVDGSMYLTTALSKERVRVLIDSFLNGAEDWREGLEWELTSLPSKRAARRIIVLLLIGGVLVALVCWLAQGFGR